MIVVYDAASCSFIDAVIGSDVEGSRHRLI